MRMVFILDPSSMPQIISLYQIHGMLVLNIVYYMTRTYVYGLHRKKLILTGKWPYSDRDPNYCNLNRQTYSQNVSGAVPTTNDVPRALQVDTMTSDQITSMTYSSTHAVALSNTRPNAPPDLGNPLEYHDVAMRHRQEVDHVHHGQTKDYIL